MLSAGSGWGGLRSVGWTRWQTRWQTRTRSEIQAGSWDPSAGLYAEAGLAASPGFDFFVEGSTAGPAGGSSSLVLSSFEVMFGGFDNIRRSIGC